MSKFNRWNHEPDVVPQDEEFLASSEAFPGVYGEGATREEAIDNFWEGVEFIGELARAPDWPHDRSPYVEEWETLAGEGEGWEGEAQPRDGAAPREGALPWEEDDLEGDQELE